MKIKRILVILAMALILSAGMAFAQGQSGTTLAGYKTLDICVVDPTVENPYGTKWIYSGLIAVWNQGAIDTIGLNITDFIEYKTGTK